MSLVLDASVALAWFLDQPTPAYAMRVRQALTDGTRAIVPAIWHLEVANVLAVAERRKILAAQDASFALVQLEDLTKQAIESDNQLVPIRSALNIARTFQLSAYDGVYLQAARTHGLPLATLDKKLSAAATRAGIPRF